MYFVYMLRCAGDTLYTGITTDLSRRLAQHQGQRSGGAKYTASHPPRSVVMVWQAPSHAAAARLEWQIKRLSRQEKERLIREPAGLCSLCPPPEGGEYRPCPELTGPLNPV